MAMVADALLSQSFSELLRTVIDAEQTTATFKHELKQLKVTLESIAPIMVEIEMQNRILDRTDGDYKMLIDEIQGARGLVLKCSKMKWNYFKRINHSQKLKEVNGKLLRLLQSEVQAHQSRDIKETLVEVKELHERMTKLASNNQNVRKLGRTQTLSRERQKLGWRVPILPRRIVVLQEPLQNLKAKVLADSFVDNSVVVVAAPHGCGKTSLVNMLCYHPDIQDVFGENIFFVTVSKTSHFMEIVNDLFNTNLFSEKVSIQNSEDAKNMLEKFLLEEVSRGHPVLLVLDRVRSDSFIKNFEFKITGYKILVTSRMFFPQYDVFQLDPLSDDDAKSLFHSWAFTEQQQSTRPSPIIDNDLVDQMIQHCNKHPLTLSVVGSSLNGKYESVWKFVLKTLSQGQWDLDNKDVLKHLQRNIEELDERFKKCILDFEALDEELKPCLLDFGLFGGDQRIPACALLDVWVHLYDHDDMGRDTLTKIFQLSYRKLVSSVSIGEEANAVVNYCEQTFVTLQDLLWELAIHLSSKEPVIQRTRLIIDAQGEDLPASIRQVNEPMQARILSISTGESFSSRWCNINVPEVEILVLNLMSETYTLPHFLEEMQKLKILHVTNYGLYPIKLGNFHLFGSLTSLTRIRLEHLAISPLTTSIVALVNLEKLALIKCKLGNAFKKLSSSDNLNVWPRLVELEMDCCQDLLGLPEIFCNSVNLEKLSITNCNEMCGLPEEFGEFPNLETLSLRSCTKLEKFPESSTRLQKLRILDISDCLSLSKLPDQIGKLGSLRMIYMKGCARVHELPPSVKELCNTEVFCDEEISSKWQEFPNVKVPAVEEDKLLALINHLQPIL